jgi:Tfp pilus assembly protein PilF
MFDKAIIEFEKAIELAPDFLLARLHLAFMQMRKNNDSEAYRHFRFIVSLSEEAQMKAISYNAMGCIQAKHANMEQAQQLFKLSYTTDPSCVEPMINMGICMSQHQAEWNQPGSEYMH